MPPSLGVSNVYPGQRLSRLALVQCKGQQAVPVHVQPDVERRIGENGRGPFDGMDLGHHRGVDEPRDIEEAVVVPVGVGLVQHVADGVVLAHEKGVQHRNAHPPVAGEAGLLDALPVHRQRAVAVQSHFAEQAATQVVLRVLVAAVDLRAVPPVRDLVDRTRRGRLQGTAARRVGLGPADEDLALPVATAPRVIRRQRHRDHGVGEDLAVVDPVAVHELDPRCGQQVEEGDFGHRRPAIGTARPRQQPAADLARIRCEELRARLGVNG